MTDAATPLPGEDPMQAPRISRRIQYFLYLAITLFVLIALLWPDGSKSGAEGPSAPSERPIVLLPSGHIQIQESSLFYKRLDLVTVAPKTITSPVMAVTGTVVASLRPGKSGGRDWQFNSPELLATYTDWRKSLADIAFAKVQRDSIRQLAETRLKAQEALVRRLGQLVEAGTETEKDLSAARTDLLQARIQGQKDAHEADSAWRVAQRMEAALNRQLQQEGVDPELLRLTTEEIDIVVADVPESLASRVKLGQACEARFVSVNAKRFTGTVRSLSPVLSKERRSLRVLFTIQDPDDQLRPGMFADIGLGTDSREALLAPLAGVVHVGRSDFMLVRDVSGGFVPVEVQVGEPWEAMVEILGGLKAGERVLGQGAILLKPFIVESLRRPGGQPRGGR
jgi:membrane fusion protein, heavy metal efflux system